MIRVIAAAVSISLVLAFVAINQYLLSNQHNAVPPAPSDLSTKLSDASAMPVDNNQRGAHSYFAAPRFFSNRYPTHNQVGINLNAGPSPAAPADLSGATEAVTVKRVEQDLLRSGYLGDNVSIYKPAFGSSR